ncbi:MAG: hypothetical protein JO264_09705 [Acidisphaera sp.]|nr:hypothetical protein [Acidisphaera sp.]
MLRIDLAAEGLQPIASIGREPVRNTCPPKSLSTTMISSSLTPNAHCPETQAVVF